MPDSDLQAIRRRWRDALLPTKEKDRRAVLTAALAQGRTLRPDGTWADIDYKDQARSKWALGSGHSERLNLLSRAYAVAPAGHERNVLRDAAVRALGWWATHDPQNPNWWWNQIGTGQYLSEVILFLGDAAPADLAAFVTEKVLPRSEIPGTGANLVWLRGNRFSRGVLTDKPELVASALQAIYNEIRVVAPGREGIQADFSFHQHGPQLYNGGYGFFYGNDCARFAVFTWGTRFQIPTDKLAILTGYLLDGQQWMIRGDVFDFSAVGRTLTRENNVAVPRDWAVGPISPPGAAYGLPRAAELLGTLPGVPRKVEYAAFARRLWAGETPRPQGEKVGNRHYWRSDYQTHRRDAYLFTIRMYSSRLQNTEIVNDEGKRSYHLADGTTLLYKTGAEYRDIFPLWDWRKIPGTTAEQGDPALKDMGRLGRRGATDYAGGVSDGVYGLAAFDFSRDALTARKAWACFDDEIVCLGANIACTSDRPVVTTVEQCWAAPGGVLPGANGVVRHNGVAYRFLDGYPVGKGVVEKRTGRWTDIGVGSDRPTTGNVFTLTIDHGVQPTGDKSRYAYVVVPDGKTSDGSDTVIVANGAAKQAAYHRKKRILLAAFYEPGTVTAPNGLTLITDQPCAVCLRPDGANLRVTVANPRCQPLAVTLTLKQSGKPETALRFDLPSGGDAGRSITKMQ